MSRALHRVLPILLWSVVAWGQSNRGELRLKVTDPTGLGIKTTVQIVSEANQYHNTLTTGDDGALSVQRLGYGLYQLSIEQSGFAPASATVDIHSSLPTEYTVKLSVAPVNESVTVKAEGTLLDPERAGSVNVIGSARPFRSG